jgi:Cys-tRNA(Pro) deacylase
MIKHAPETQATSHLKALGIAYVSHIFEYIEHGGTAEPSKQLGLEVHAVIKTLVMQDEKGSPLIVLMHGDCTVSTKNLARCVGAKKIESCKPEVAYRHTAYQAGGTSPFGIQKVMPVYVERTILSLPSIYISGGRRGFIVQIDPQVLANSLGAISVDCALAV